MPNPHPPIGNRIKPGQVLNPGGLPKSVRQARKLAAKMCPEAIETLQKWMRDPKNAKASIAACLALLDRGLGKVAPMEKLHPGAIKRDEAGYPLKPGELSDEALAQIMEIMKREMG